MDPSSNAPVQNDDESYNLSMSILKNVGRNYSPEPLEKLVTPRLTSKPLMLKAFLDLDFFALPAAKILFPSRNCKHRGAC